MADWLDYLDKGTDAASKIISARNPAPLPAPAPTAATTNNKWIVPALIGGGVLIVVLMFMGRGD